MKSRIMRWAGHVAFMKDAEMNTGLRWKDMKERDNLEDLGLMGG